MLNYLQRINALFVTCVAAMASLVPANVFAQTLENPSFEDSIFVNNGYAPSGWSNDGFGFGYTSDAHHGSKAVKIWNWYYYGEGWLVNGETQSSFWGGGSPFVGSTVALTGYYKYELGQNQGAADSAFCDLLLFRFNTSTQSRDTLAYSRKLLGPAASYTYFETWVDNQTFQVQSDSLVITFSSSVDGFCDNQSSGECLYLTIDDLQLELPVGVPMPLGWDGDAAIYPSPGDGRVHVNLPEGMGNEADLEVFAMDGKKLLTKRVVERKSLVDLSSLPAGTHTWELTGKTGKKHYGKIVIQ